MAPRWARDDQVKALVVAQRLNLPRAALDRRLARARAHSLIHGNYLSRAHGHPYVYRWADILAVPALTLPLGARLPTPSTAERHAAMVTARHVGQTLQQIADAHGLTRSRVQQLLSTIQAGPRSRVCRRCGAIYQSLASRTDAYCRACRTETRPCGAAITRDRGRDRATFRNRHWFCDRRCFGRWLGRRFGGGRRHKHSRRLRR